MSCGTVPDTLTASLAQTRQPILLGVYGVVIVQGQGDHLEQYYDLQSGLLAFSRYRVDAQGVGAQVTELQLVGRQ